MMYLYICIFFEKSSIGGLVGYDAALTRLRSRVQFPLDVFLPFYAYLSPFKAQPFCLVIIFFGGAFMTLFFIRYGTQERS